MATSWHFTIVDENEDHAKWAAHELNTIIDGMEAMLSRFDPTSSISRLKNLQHGQRLRLPSAVYECLLLAKAVHQETAQAFDISIGSGADSHMNAFELIAETEEIESRTDQGLHLDLGGIGKGFALDEMAAFLTEHEMNHALLNAGGSTIYALGDESPGDGEGWPVDLRPDEVIALRQQAISASGFEVKGYHVIDPSTKRPVKTERQRSWVIADSAALADALSTAALVMTEEAIDAFSQRHPDIAIMLL